MASPAPKKSKTHKALCRSEKSDSTARLVTRLTHLRKKGKLDNRAVRAFRKVIHQYYRESGRSLPWRETRNPYHIFVSEIMLQQTQVERVISKYEHFIAVFPHFPSLAKAPLRKVFEAWQGLGYNRRALALKESATMIMEEFSGRLPQDPSILIRLPGVGKVTAASIAAFAFNKPTLFIETNIRRVFIHVFFQGEENIKDSEILPLVEKTLGTSNPREWYYALMDYGVMLGKNRQNPNRRSAHYKKQSPFEGSARQLRGLILKTLISGRPLSDRQLARQLTVDIKKIRTLLLQLEKEGFITEDGKKYKLS